ncbi:phage terminase small subunit P27 family [Lacticaseibacillus daqingensis]|uniref:phage terminase small subunit P27 family n=1 Tax=Lacticaseibacillus daqingensis TaxID=2486014 RepID=UPI000F7B4703|nr:phage terminase small subunit P27 family [Lacticaseibacillus daqingensis]
MVGRKPKLTTDPSDRADQRARTAALMNATKSYDCLQERAPKHLSGVARSTWESLVPQLNRQGLVKQIDKQIVTALCEQVQLERMAWIEIQENGVVIDGRKNPACQVLDSATAKVKSLSDSLGLNPQARASLITVENNNHDDEEVDIISKLKGKSGDNDW